MVYSDNGEMGNRSVNKFGSDFNTILDNRHGVPRSDVSFGDNVMRDSTQSDNLLFVYRRDGGYERYDKNGTLQDVEAGGTIAEEEKESRKRKLFKRYVGSEEKAYSEPATAQVAEKKEKKGVKLDKRMNKKLVVLLVSYVALIAIIIVMVSLSNYVKANRNSDVDAELQASAATSEQIYDNTDPYYFGKTGIVIASDSEEEVTITEKKETNDEYRNPFDKFCDFIDKIFGGR